MAERAQGPAPGGQRRPVSASFAFNPGLPGRGPTYERAQRLLEERRARAQAQSSSAKGLVEHDEAARPIEQRRAHLSLPSPESDESFAFDRPAVASDGGASASVDETLRDSYQQRRQQQQQLPRSEDNSTFAQAPWQAASQFEAPPGHLDYDESVEGAFDAADHFGTAAQPPGAPPQDAQPPYSLDYPAEHDEVDPHEHHQPPSPLPPPPQQGLDLPVGGDNEQNSLAELEQLLNKTMLDMMDNMRVPSSKDMAFGMAHGDGPFDISDIWAMDSQPSGSQRSASHRRASLSGDGASRDDGQEVNSYAGTFGPESSLSPESSMGGLQHQQQRTGRRTQLARPGSGRAQPLAHEQQQQHRQEPLLHTHPHPHPRAHHPQQQQRQPSPGRQSQLLGNPGGRGGGGSSGAGSQQQDPLRRLQQQQHHRHAQATHQQGGLLLQQQQQQPVSGSRQQQPPRTPRGHNVDAIFLRRPSTPTAGSILRRNAYPRVSPRYNQPSRQAAGAVSPRVPAEDYTFQPQINPRSREIAERLLPVDRDRRLEQLSRPRNERLEQRYEQLRQAKEEEELRGCTFQPQTGRPPSIPRLRGNVPVHDRLYNVKPAWQLKREEILREREQAVLASCTFQPQCGSRQNPDPVRRSSSAMRRRPASAAAATGGGGGGGGGELVTPYVPIHQRVADLLRSRNEKLAKAQVKMELGGGSVTFQPEINRRSAQLAAERQRQQPAELAALPASERLYRLAQEQAAGGRRRGDDSGSGQLDVSAHRDQRNHQQQQQQQPGMPAINPRSRALAESSDLPQDFLARQAYLAALGHEKRALYRSLLEESTCTFQPQLLSRAGSMNSSGCLGLTPRGGAGGGFGSRPVSGSGSFGEGDRLSKLAYEDVQRSAALRDALEQHHYGQFTFAPAINERSRRIGRRHSLTDLYRDDERQAKLERLATETEAQRAAECTFRPAINPRSASLGRQRRGSLVLASTEAHEQVNKLRSSILTEARALREYEELKECTFTPAINRSAPKHTGPVAVPGLGRHLELKDLARRKREAEEARKAEVWNTRPKSPGPQAGFTIPRPFSFETRVLPWQVPRAQMIQQHQEQEQQRGKALAALKQQRQQHRKEAEDRRSAHLHKIMQEAQAVRISGHSHQQQQPQLLQQQQQEVLMQMQMQQLQQQQQHPGGSMGAVGSPVPAGASAAAYPQARSAINGRGGGGGSGRQRCVSFQSPSSGGDVYDRSSSHGVAEMPVDYDGRGGQQGLVAGRTYGAAESYGDDDGDFTFPGSPQREELTVRFM